MTKILADLSFGSRHRIKYGDRRLEQASGSAQAASAHRRRGRHSEGREGEAQGRAGRRERSTRREGFRPPPLGRDTGNKVRIFAHAFEVDPDR
jgi:hypothetical protein